MALAHPPPLSPSRRALAASPGKWRQRPLTALAHLIRFTTAGLPAEDNAVRVALRNQSDHGFTLAFSCPACGPDSSVRVDAASNCSARGVFKWHVAEYLHHGVAEAAIQSSVPWETMPVACGGGSGEGGTCIVDVDDLLPGTLYHCQVQFEDAAGHLLARSELIEIRTSAAMPPPLGAPLVVAVSWDAVDVTIDAGAMSDVLAPMDHHRPSSGGRRRATGSAHQSRPPSAAASRSEPVSPSKRAMDTRTPVDHSDVWSRAVACPPSAARDRVQVVIADSFTAILATPPPTVAEANGKHIAGTQQDGSHAPRFVTWWYPSAVAPARAHMACDFTVRLSGMAEEGTYVCSTRRVTADALVSEWSPPVSVRTKLMPPPTPRLRVDTSSSTFTTHATTLAVECQGPVPLGLSLVTTVFDLTDQASDELRLEAFTRDLVAFYGTHNPDKSNSVAQVAARYRGEEATLFAELERRYDTRSMSRGGVSLSARWRELCEETDGPERLWVFNATAESAERRGVVHRTHTTPLARSLSDAMQRTLEQAVRFDDLPACATLGLIHVVTNREGRKSEPAVLVTRLPPPQPPAHYAVSAITARSANLRWSGLLIGKAAVGRYTLWRRSGCDASDGAWTDWVQVRGAAVESQHDATVTASIGGLEPNTRYQICATVAVGRNDVDEPPSVTATAAEVRTTTAAPSNLRGFAAVIDGDAGEHQLCVMFTSNDNGVPPVTAELAVALLDASHVPFAMTGTPAASSAEPDGGAETASEFAPVAPGKFASDAVPIARWAPSAPHSAACTVKVLWADLLEAFDGSDTCKAFLRRALAARRAENSERMATSAQWLRAPPRKSRSALSTVVADLPLTVCATAVRGLHLRLRVAIRLSCARAGATPVAYGTVDVEC
jgi:hypothetical protein